MVGNQFSQGNGSQPPEFEFVVYDENMFDEILCKKNYHTMLNVATRMEIDSTNNLTFHFPIKFLIWFTHVQ